MKRPSEERHMGRIGTDAVTNASGFRVSCDGGKAGQFDVDTSSIWVKVGQRIQRNGTAEIWDSVVVEGRAEQGGTLVVRVVVFNPDWDEPLQIACIRSRPDDAGCLTALGCNLDHVAI